MADPADVPCPCPSKVSIATLKIIERGRYQVTAENVNNLVISLEPHARLKGACSSTTTVCTPHVSLPPPPQGAESAVPPPQMTLFAGDAFDAAQWVIAAHSNASLTAPCVLDFASDSEPGGGWKGKQRGTQEEDLCRRSNLGVCLEEHFKRVGVAAYMPSFSAVYVPDVVVFRASKSYRCLRAPFWVSVIAAALRCMGSDRDIRAKIDGVLRTAGKHGHRSIVLGAWGCGAFGNDPAQIASIMTAAVCECSGWFDHVVFAIPPGNNFQAFLCAIPGCAVFPQNKDAPVDSTAAMFLTEQNKWELIAILPDVIAIAVTRASIEPARYSSTDGLRQVAEALLAALKDVCLDELAATTPVPLLERIRAILSPTSSIDIDSAGDMSEIERDICSAFQESARQLVTEIVKERRRALKLAVEANTFNS